MNMLAANLTRALAPVASPITAAAIGSQNVRGMATLKDIRMRLKSVKNIQKITQSMKMVSAAKYARAERDLKPARSFGSGAQQFYKSSELAPPEPEEDKEAVPQKPGTLIIAMTSDRGLCGAVHSSVARRIRAIMNNPDTPDKGNIRLVLIGDKSRSMLSKQFRDNVLLTFNEFGKRPPQFNDAVTVANAILDSGVEFENGILIYNRFRTVVSYRTTEMPVFSLSAITQTPTLSVYDSLDSDVLRSYYEYSLASLLFYAMKENACSEQSARMSAMDSASKNAGEMIDKLQLTYNRTRQAVITKELIEIISGAAAL